MELTMVDRLLLYLIDGAKNVTMAMRTGGYVAGEVSSAYEEASAVGYLESTTSGEDRLTPAGWARAAYVKNRQPD